MKRLTISTQSQGITIGEEITVNVVRKFVKTDIWWHVTTKRGVCLEYSVDMATFIANNDSQFGNTMEIYATDSKGHMSNVVEVNIYDETDANVNA